MSEFRAMRSWSMYPETMEKLKKFLVDYAGATESQLQHPANVKFFQRIARELCEEMEVGK